MKKVKLTRDHNGYAKGDTIEVAAEQIEYFERVGLIEQSKENKVDKTKLEKK